MVFANVWWWNVCRGIWEHHGRVCGYGDGVSPTILWVSSSSTIRDVQMQLNESKERHKENDANLLR